MSNLSPLAPPSPSPPSPTSSDAESILPTPDQPYHSRQSSLASVPSNSPPLATLPSLPPKTPPLASVELSRDDTIVPSIPAPSYTAAAAGSPSMSKRNTHSPGASGRSPRAQRRAATMSSSRAPPPPPILLRRPTDMTQPHRHTDAIPLTAGSSGSDKSPARSTFGGLNISGVDGNLPHTEEGDSLSELLRTPARASFFPSSAASPGIPLSPAWQSFEKTSPHFSPAVNGKHRPRGSMDAPFSPLGAGRASPAARSSRFEPTPEHGLHARNLSLYFPQPGSQEQADGKRSGSPLVTSPEVFEDTPQFAGEAPAGSSESKERKKFGGTGDWSFGQSHSTLAPETAEGTKKSKRRGHHHKHSLSHNFFSFLDPTQTNPALASSKSPSPVESASPRRADTPQKVPMTSLLSAPLISSNASPALSPLPPSKNTSHQQMLASLGVLEFLIGAGLWVEGQMSGWRCLAALGYLVVFDAMGVGVSLIGAKGDAWSNIRRPYGSARFLSLMYFAQSIFLVFAAVYIAKEALEQVVLGSGAHEHAVGGAHSHGEPVIDGDERPFPHFLLVSAVLASLFSGGALDNHAKLVEAVGPLFLPLRLTSSRLAKSCPALLANPFSLTIAGTAIAILVGSTSLHPTSFHTLDSSLSLILTVLTIALSYPPTLAFGHVLLQTAPPASSTQMKNLRRTVKDIAGDQRVLGVGTMRCWSVGATRPLPDNVPSSPRLAYFGDSSTPGHSVPSSPRTPFAGHSPNLDSPTRPGFFGNSASSYPTRMGDSLSTGSSGQGATPLVVSLIVHVHSDASDRDVLDVTKLAWTKVSTAVSCKRKALAMGSSEGEGEICVSIKRGWDRVGE